MGGNAVPGRYLNYNIIVMLMIINFYKTFL